MYDDDDALEQSFGSQIISNPKPPNPNPYTTNRDKMMEMSAALMSEKQQSMQFERKWKSECQVMSLC